jgi:hypothetical protein
MMPYQLVWEPKGVFWQYSGNVTGEEVIEASSLIYGDSRFDNLKYKLVDFLGIKSIEMSADELALVAFQHRAAELSNQAVKIAILIGPDNDLAEQFAAFFVDSHWEVKVFEERENANLWLNRKVQ